MTDDPGPSTTAGVGAAAGDPPGSTRPRTSTRDLAALRGQLERWLGGHVPGARVGDLSAPGSAGMSSETLLFDLHRPDGSVLGCAARLAPAADAVPIFPRYDLLLQAEAMRLVRAQTELPVPDILWSEDDPDAVGSPIFVMARVEGAVPPDLPPYTFGGNWLYDASLEERQRVERSAVGVLAGVHRIPAGEDTEAFAPLGRGGNHLARHLAVERDYYRWVSADWVRSPLIERALDHLEAHQPVPSGDDVLCWGDARLGNLMFRDLAPVAVLDWEMVTVGPPELDVGWLITQHRFFQDLAVTFGLPGLPDFLERTAVERRYEELTGHRPRDLDWYTLYAAVRFASIYLRIAQRQVTFGELVAPEDPDDLLLHRGQIEAMLAGTYW